MPPARGEIQLPIVPREVYERGGEVARGGMGRIVRAKDVRIGRRVAIKESLNPTGPLAERFEREAVITARLQHPSIVPVYEAGRWPDGDPFYAMKLIAGRPLDQVVAATQTLDERIALLPHVISVCEALAYAHDRGIVHRDLKPANVLVGEYGETVVIDWGLAKDLSATEDDATSTGGTGSGDLTMVGAQIGTPAYMAPEQARGEAVDRRADVYALGAMLYQVLAGEMPYVGAKTAKDLLERVLAAPPPDLETRVPDVPRALAAVVRRAMERKPAARYPTAGELAADLRRYRDGQLVSVHRYSTREMVARWVRKHRAAVATGVVALGALAVIAVISVRSVLDARDLAEARRAAVLEEQGRQQVVAGSPSHALPYLAEAWRSGRHSPTLALLLGEAMPAIDDIESAVVAADAPLSDVRAVSGGFVTRSEDDVFRVWRGGTSGPSIAPGGTIAAWAASPDGTRIAFAGERVLVAGDDGTTIADLPVEASRVSIDADRLVTIGAGRAMLWDLASTPPRALVSADGATDAVLAERGGALAMVATTATEAQAWDAATGTALAPIALLDPNAWLSADGRTLIAVANRQEMGDGWVHHEIRAVDLASGRALDTDVLSAEIRGVAVTPGRDGTVSWDDHWLAVFDAGAGRIAAAQFFPEQLIEGVRTLRAGDRAVAAVLRDGVVTILDLASGLRLGNLEGHAGRVRAFEVALDGTHLYTAGEDGRVVTWALQPRLVLSGPPGSVAVAPDGARVATVDGQIVRILGTPATTLPAPGGARALDVAWAAGVAAIVDEAGVAHLIELADGHRRATLPSHAQAIAFSADASRLVTVEDDRLRVWSADDGTPIATLAGHTDIVTRAVWSPDGRFLLSGGEDGDVRLWDPADPAPVVVEDGIQPVGALAFAPDGRQLAIASGDGKVRVYPITSARAVGDALELPGHGDPANALAFAPDGRTLASGGGDGVVRLWTLPAGKELAVLDPRGGPIGGVAFRDDGAIVATASAPGYDDRVSLWDARTGAELSRRQGAGTVGFLDDGRLLRVLGSGGAAVWRLGGDLPRDLDGAIAAAGTWMLVDGRLVPRVAVRPRRPPPAPDVVYDFTGDTVESEVHYSIFALEPGAADTLVRAQTLMQARQFAEAGALAAGLATESFERDDELHVLAYLRYYAGDLDGAYAAALAGAERADKRRVPFHLLSLVEFAPLTSVPVSDAIASLEHLAPKGTTAPLGDLADRYAAEGRIDDAFIVLEHMVATGRDLVSARIQQARIAGAMERPESQAAYTLAAIDAAARTDPGTLGAVIEYAQNTAATLHRLYMGEQRDRRYGDAARRLYRRLSTIQDALTPEAAGFAADLDLSMVQNFRNLARLEKTQLRRSIRARLTQVASCYERALISDPALAGTIAIDLTIDALGGVDAAESSADPDTEPLRAVAACVAARARTWTFGTGRTGTRLRVHYPFELKTPTPP